MTSPASLNVEPPAFDLPPAFDPQPAEGLEEIEILPFKVAKFKEAITERLRAIGNGEDVQQWMGFLDFDSSKLKYIDQRRFPIRVQVDGNTLVIKMVHPVHEAMHTNLLDHIKQEMRNMGLRPSHDYINIGSGRCNHRSGTSSKEADNSIAPTTQLQPWPALDMEAGWSESVSRLRIDAQWWLSAQLPPNNTTLVVLISFKRSQRTFCLEKYEIVPAAIGIRTRSAPTGLRNIARSTGTATIDLRTTPPTIIGAPFMLPFTGIMRRPPTAAERDISLSAAGLETWATTIATSWNL